MSKRWIIALVAVLSVGTYLGYANILEQQAPREFKFIYGLKHCGGGYEQNTVDYVVYVTNYDEKLMLQKIYDFHTNMNGISDELTINLYNSEEDWENSCCTASRTYYKDSEE